MFVFTGYAIDQSRVDVEEVDPNYMMATLIFFLKTQRAVRDGEGSPCTRTCHSFSEASGLKNPHTSDHSPGTLLAHKGVGPGGKGKFVLTNGSSILLMNRESLDRLVAPCGIL